MLSLNDDSFADAVRSAGDSVYATTCSRWSSKRRVMGHPFEGNYSTKYFPWCRGILDSEATYNISLKSAQAGFTEVGINRALWTIDTKRQNVLYVLPTKGNASDFSKSRFDNAIDLSPYLKNLFTDTNTVGLKRSNQSSLYIRGARSEADLKSIPASVLILDEFDEMSPRAVQLAIMRLSGQLEKTVFYISTPTIPGFGVSKEVQSSTQEVFTFKCPGCSRHINLTPDNLVVVGDGLNDPRIDESYIKCIECDKKLPQEGKFEYLQSGVWVPTHTNGDPDRRGFQINQLYSSTVTPKEIAQSVFESHFSEAAAQELNNSRYGLPFLGASSRLTMEQIDACVQDYRKNTLHPEGGSPRLIVMGVDQGRQGYTAVCEVTFDEGWEMDPLTFMRLKVLELRPFDQHNEELRPPANMMSEWQVRACVCDADPEIGQARKFARSFPGHVWLSRYRLSDKGKLMAPSEEETGATILTSDRTFWVGETLNKFRTGQIELPVDTPLEFKNHMRAMVKRYKRVENSSTPVATFVNIAPDHYLHCLVYACQAALRHIENSGNQSI